MLARITEDFPAAHSMDTTWFGVDDAGEIALFDTGENGAVPEVAKDREPEYENWQDLFSKLPPDDKGVRHIPADGRPLAALCRPETLTANLKNRLFFVAIFASEEAIIPPPGDRTGSISFRFSGPDIVVYYYYPPPQAEVERAVKEGAIIGLLPARRPRIASLFRAQGLSADQVRAGRVKGIWRHSWVSDYNWYRKYIGVHIYDEARGYYEAAVRPIVPLKLSDFSIEDIGHTGFVPLPGVRFAETAALQPVAMMECSQWDSVWTGVDGSIHPAYCYRYGKMCDPVYKSSRLCDRYGEPLDVEAWRRMAIRPLGVLPAPIDWRACDQLDDLLRSIDHGGCVESPDIAEDFLAALTMDTP